MKNASIQKVLHEISSQSDFTFAYSSKFVDVTRKISVQVKNSSINNLLDLIFKGTGIKFQIIGRKIVLTPSIKNTKQTQPAKIIVHGTVRSSNGETLPGVNISVKGTTEGTVSDPNGKYSIPVHKGDFLVFSFVGYQTQTIEVNQQRIMNIVLKTASTGLNEVVVVGYGTQKESSVTSAIAQVKASDFNKGEINNPLGLLQGKVAGLAISRVGSNPNGGYAIRLRGLSTIGANSSPLIVIDGVPGASLNDIDPTDIASVSVLKGASAAAIYGTRAASGVIIITTKSGHTSRRPYSHIEYSVSATASTIAKEIKVLSPEQYRNWSGAFKSTDLGSATNWFNEIMHTGMDMVHNLALSGGGPNSAYRVSVNYRNVQGILKKTGFKKISAFLDMTQHALKRHAVFKFHLATGSVNRQLGFPVAFRYAVNMNPTAPVYDPQNTMYGGYYQMNLTRAYNPVSIINQNINIRKGLHISGNLSGEYDFSNFLQGLSIKALYAQNQGAVNQNYFSPSTAKINGVNHSGWASKDNNSYVNWLAQATIHYQRTVFKNLTFNLLGGYSYQDFINSSTSVAGGDFISNAFSFNNLSAARDFANGLGNVGSYKAENKLIAFFGRINLNLLDTYYLMVSIRHEGSSRFGKNHQWGNFPALSGGIQLTKLVTIPYVNSLKIRAGYGITGQDAPGDYLTETLLGEHGYFLANGQYIPGYGPVSNANPNLKWETKHGLDIGLDFEMFKDRLSGSFDYYHNVTKDLIYDATVPVPPNLASHEWINVGTLENAGFEADLTGSIIRKKSFSWQSGATFTLYHRTRLVSFSNKLFDFGKSQNIDILGVPGMVNVYLIHVAVGQPIGEIWGPVFEGIKNGKWVFKDLNGDGKINQLDDTIIGNGLPKWSFGFSNTIRYKNWTLNFNLVGVFGHDLVNTYRAFYQDPTEITGYNVLESTLQIKQLTEAHKFSSFFVENASYVRLNNAILAYNFPIKHGKISRLQINLSGQNLFTITRYSGADPSVRYSDNGNLLAPGIDRRGSWFSARLFTLGLDVTF